MMQSFPPFPKKCFSIHHDNWPWDVTKSLPCWSQCIILTLINSLNSSWDCWLSKIILFLSSHGDHCPWKHSPQYLPSLIKRASVPCNNNILPIIPLPPTASQISQSIYTIWNMTIPRDTEMWLIVSSSILYRAKIGNVFYGQYPFSWGHPSQTSFQSRRPKATLGRKTIPTKEHRDPQEAAATNFLKIDFAENLPHNPASKFSYLVSLQIKTLLRID